MIQHLNYRDVKNKKIQNLDLGRHHHDSQCTRSHCKMHPTEPAMEYWANDDALLPLSGFASKRTGISQTPSHVPSSLNVSESLALSPELTVVRPGRTEHGLCSYWRMCVLMVKM